MLHYIKSIYKKNPGKAIILGTNYFHDPGFGDKKEKARLALYTGASYYFSGQPDSSLYYLDSCLVLSQTTNDKELLAQSYNAQSILHLYLGNYQKAFIMNKKAFAFYRELNDTAAMMNSLKGIANVYIRMNYEDSAIHYSLKALQYIEKKQDPKNLRYKGGILMNIGTILINAENYEQAKKYYKNAEKIFINIGEMQELARLYHNIGTIFSDFEQRDSAIYYFLKSADLKKKYNLKRNLSSTLFYLSQEYGKLKKTEKQKYYLNKTLETAMAVGDKTYIPDAMISFLNHYVSEKKKDSAKYYFKKIQNLEHPEINPQSKSMKHKAFSGYYALTGNATKALEEYKKYHAVHETVRDTKMAKITQELEKKYQTVQKEKENEKLKNQLLQKKHEKQQQKRFLIILSIILIMLSAILILLVKLLKTRSKSIQQLKKIRAMENEKSELEITQYQQKIKSEKKIRELQKEKYQQDIALKKRELSASAMQIMEKNKILQKIRETIKNAEDPFLEKRANQLLNESFNFDKDWHTLKMHFEQVHPVFFSTLKKKIPALTDYDLRLAAYLKMNLSTKEISQILHITPSAVSKSRQRLRKKIGIKSRMDFHEYFSQFS